MTIRSVPRAIRPTPSTLTFHYITPKDMLNFVTTVGVILQHIAVNLALQYDDLWQGSGAADESNVLMQVMAGSNLIFVVLAVSLVIWFVFIFFLMRVERKLAQLEKKHSE